MPQAVTNRRVRRKAAALLAPQSGKGVLVDNFPAASAERLWSRELNVAIDDPKSLPGPWMTELETEGEGARYSIMERTAGKALVMATPKSVEYLLRSNWGPYGAGVLSLASQVSEYFTLAWIEDVASGSPQNLVRAQDAWFHRVVIRATRSSARVVLDALYEGRTGRVDPLNALPGGVVLPASPRPPPPPPG